MSGVLFLMFVQSMFQFGAKGGEMGGLLRDKNYLDMSFFSFPEFPRFFLQNF